MEKSTACAGARILLRHSTTPEEDSFASLGLVGQEGFHLLENKVSCTLRAEPVEAIQKGHVGASQHAATVLLDSVEDDLCHFAACSLRMTA